MLAVLAMISILAVAASPSFVLIMRDRRVTRVAMQIVDYFRTARTMAIGRGQPIVLAYNTAGYLPIVNANTGTGGMRIIEPNVTTASATNSCQQTNWSNFQAAGTVGGVQVYSTFDIQNGHFEYASVTAFDDTGAAPAYLEYCFSPTGRMYLRTGTGGTANTSFHAVTGVPSFTVLNLLSGRPRLVFVPPNGVARMER
jgi:type IV fimbrial biogenesis protein FimT